MNLCHRVALAVCLAFCLHSQDAPLTKDAIIQMVKAGLPEDVIVAKIRSEAIPPKLNTDDLIALKSAGASDGVLRALVNPASKVDTAPATAAAPVSSNSADADNPLAPH